MAPYTIGQVARRVGVSTSTLRFYEQQGVLEPAGRTAAGYRLYDDRALRRLAFVGRAKQLGCSLEEITELAALWEADACGPVQARLHQLVTEKIDDAQRRGAELIRLTAELQTAAAHLGGDPVDGPCGETCACLADPDRAPSSAPTPVALGERADPQIACTLPAGEVPGRIADWQRVLTHVTAREALDGGVRLVLGSDIAVDEVLRMATAEQGCCSFFAFAITVDARGVGLEVRAPHEAAELVTVVFGSAP